VIVVDSNVVAYFWINGPLTGTAQRLWAKDAEWHVPLLWRSELRSILTGYLRDGTLDATQIAQVMAAAEATFADREHLVSSEKVFAIVGESKLSAYDAEFVALAEVLAVPLVTADKAVLKAFPERALTMQAFAAGERSGS
jgi:predicted nucleic acid-binding protein